MIHRLSKLITCALFLAGTFALAACASEPEQKKEEPVQKTKTTKKPVQVEKPSPEELKNSPCGNPDWAQLPAGAEDKAPKPEQEPAEEPEQPGEGDADEGDADKASGEQEQSNKAELYPTQQPCT